MTRCAYVSGGRLCHNRAVGTFDGEPHCAECLPVCAECGNRWAEYHTADRDWLCDECSELEQVHGDEVVRGPANRDPGTERHTIEIYAGSWAQHGPGGRPEQAKTVRTWSPPEVRERERVA